MRLLRRVVAGDKARQHSRVGGEHVTRDEGEAHPGGRAHPEALEHRDVAVAAADQHDVGRDGRGRAGHRARARRHGRSGRTRGNSGRRVVAEEGGSRTHRTRLTRPIGFEVRAAHRAPILSPASGQRLVLPPRFTRGARPSRRERRIAPPPRTRRVPNPDLARQMPPAQDFSFRLPAAASVGRPWWQSMSSADRSASSLPLILPLRWCVFQGCSTRRAAATTPRKSMPRT